MDDAWLTYTAPLRSLVAWIGEWPASRDFAFLGDYPEGREHVWSHQANGITHDRSHWYITKNDHMRIFKIPIGQQLAEQFTADRPPAGVRVAFDTPVSGWDHFGDLDHYDERLYVALEGKEWDWSSFATVRLNPLVACYDAATLEFLAAGELERQGGHAPWCAINPLDGMLYCSGFDLGRNRDGYINVYEHGLVGTGEDGLRLRKVRELIPRKRGGSAIDLGNVQGGTFSPRGHLYLSCNAGPYRGVVGIDPWTGVKEVFLPWGEGDPDSDDFDRWDTEVEGLTIWDLDDKGTRAPCNPRSDYGRACAEDGDEGRVGGQLHVLSIAGDAPGVQHGQVWLTHYRLPAPVRALI